MRGPKASYSYTIDPRLTRRCVFKISVTEVWICWILRPDQAPLPLPVGPPLPGNCCIAFAKPKRHIQYHKLAAIHSDHPQANHPGSVPRLAGLVDVRAEEHVALAAFGAALMGSDWPKQADPTLGTSVWTQFLLPLRV